MSSWLEDLFKKKAEDQPGTSPERIEGPPKPREAIQRKDFMKGDEEEKTDEVRASFAELEAKLRRLGEQLGAYQDSSSRPDREPES